jgi:hypothetical protein
MTLFTLAAYLVGSREAILRLASSRWSLALGFLFVLLAGLAREYDGEDLLREPWHLAIPLGASLATSALLYLLVRGVAWRHGATEPPLASGYLDFLGLYWLTAPLALVYAIPFERFLSAGDATRANLWMLALVALWRVVLMVRVVSVLYQTSFLSALFLVLLFADTVAVILLSNTELPIIAIMGGIRLSESESILHSTVWLMRVLTVLSWPVWLIGALVVIVRKRRWEYQATSSPPFPGLAWHLWAAVMVLIGMWVVILPRTQPEQQRRGRAERELKSGRIRQGLEYMSAHERDDFPPHWDPPPRVAYREQRPDITQVQEHLDVLAVKPWVRAIYVEKFGNWLAGDNMFEGALGELPPDQAERRIALIERMPERLQIVRENERTLQHMSSEYSEMRPDLKERIRKLLAEAGLTPPPANVSESSADLSP